MTRRLDVPIDTSESPGRLYPRPGFSLADVPELTARFLQPSNFAPLRPRYVLMSKGAPRRLPLERASMTLDRHTMLIPATARQAIFLRWTEPRAARSRKVRCWCKQ